MPDANAEAAAFYRTALGLDSPAGPDNMDPVELARMQTRVGQDLDAFMRDVMTCGRLKDDPHGLFVHVFHRAEPQLGDVCDCGEATHNTPAAGHTTATIPHVPASSRIFIVCLDQAALDGWRRTHGAGIPQRQLHVARTDSLHGADAFRGFEVRLQDILVWLPGYMAGAHIDAVRQEIEFMKARSPVPARLIEPGYAADAATALTVAAPWFDQPSDSDEAIQP